MDEKLRNHYRKFAVDGLILILLFLIYLVILIQKEGKLGKIKKQVKFKNIWKDGLIFSLALVALLLSARWLVLSTLQIGNLLDLPVYFMGLIFVAVGTTIPELTVEIRSVLKGSSALAFGDIIGSSIVNFNLVLGIACLISPFTIARHLMKKGDLRTALQIAEERPSIRIYTTLAETLAGVR